MSKLGIKHLFLYCLFIVGFTLTLAMVATFFNADINKDVIFLSLLQVTSDISAFYICTKLFIKESFIDLFGLNFKNLKNNIFLGIIGFFAAFIITIIISIIYSKISVIPEIPSTSFFSMNRDVLIFSAILIAPLREELLFRGILQPMLANKTNRIAGLIITAILFTGCHFVYGSTILIYIKLFVLSIILGILRYRSNSIVPSYVAHLLNNSVSIIGIL